MLVIKDKKMAKLTTQITSLLAHCICKVWAWGRSFRDKNNFDYFIRPVRPTISTERLPYIMKKVYEDVYERSVKLKIGGIVIEYSFGKTLEEDKNVCELFPTEYDPKDEVINSLISMTQQTHHNASVLQFGKNRKEHEDGRKHRKSNT